MSTKIVVMSGIFAVLFLVLLIYRIRLTVIFKQLKNEHKKYADFSHEDLLTYSEVSHTSFDDKKVTKQLTSSDGMDEKPLSYLILNDGGTDVFVRTFTIVMLPKRIKFGVTWAKIANFENLTTSIFKEPLTKKEASRKLDDHVTELDTEIYRAEQPQTSNRNRARKLRRQRNETEIWADRIENDDDIFYNVGFLMTLKAKKLSDLNLKTDALFKIAQDGGILISNCYGMQKEAFQSNLPFNEVKKKNGRDPVHWFLFNKEALAGLYNHTKVRFIHEDGIPIGSGLYDGYPATWDPWDKSHIHGYSVLFSGPMGVGKSACVKTLSTELVPFGYQFVSLDSQAIKGHGEYRNPCLVSGGVVYKIGRNSKNIPNPFDIEIEIDDGVEQLNVKEKIDILVYMFMTMLQADNISFEQNTYLRDIFRQACTEAYDSFGIIDGQPESLYEEGKIIQDGKILYGKKKKRVPTISFVYKQIVIDSTFENDDLEKKKAYNIALSGLTRWVRGVYYSEKSLHFFTKEEYEKMEYETVRGRTVKYKVIDNEKEEVKAVEGQSPYFDGESTYVDKQAPYIDYDFSGLSEEEKKVARSVLFPYVIENYVKKNNTSVNSTKRVILIVDEAHEQFAIGENARNQCEALSRVCRKMHAGIWWVVHACKDFDRYKSTETIFKLTDVKFVFKQSRLDDEYLKKALPLSDVQRKRLYSLNGVKEANSKSYSKPGQVCLVDGDSAYFMQIDIMPEEELVIETNMEKLKKKRGKEAMFWEEKSVV